jgi:hypothetical protein
MGLPPSKTRLLRAGMLIASLGASILAHAQEPLAKIIADGKAWEMYVVKRRASNILVFNKDGTGTISNGYASIHPTWTASPDGICIRPDAGAERCLALSRTNQGIAASQSGRTIFILRR